MAQFLDVIVSYAKKTLFKEKKTVFHVGSVDLFMDRVGEGLTGG